MSLFSQKWGIFGTTHAWIFRISWETKKKITNIVAGALRVSSPSFAKFLSSVFLTLTTLVFVSLAFLISQSSLLFIITQYHGNKYGGMRGKLQPFTNFWNLLLLWLLRAPTPSQVPIPTCLLSTQRPSSLLLDFMAILDSAVFSENDFFLQNYYLDCTLHRGPGGRIFGHIICY